ncbi:hypothetical protein [Jeotgalibacillus proteolyticus]|uniref:Uncharacterized protein n=1 Tax=Jeotgalibacillus proteolyticus TaxID=2082395 RepID=A0A2S5GF76_9BACL|nr:hypothetical protein [Jeotgalibacillus proteolyticus]PPA71702.1 hypothetical protein C4B60_06510 [Jeotgalibacillus proteolyticus]
MLFTFLFAFVVPWCIVLFIVKVNKKTIALIAPFTAIMTNILNTWTLAYDFAAVYPFEMESELASLPMVLGIIPALGSLLVHLLLKSHFSISLVIAFILISTLNEWIFVQADLIRYFKGWTIGWTFVIYLIGFTAVYLYYRLLKKWDIL